MNFPKQISVSKADILTISVNEYRTSIICSKCFRLLTQKGNLKKGARTTM